MPEINQHASSALSEKSAQTAAILTSEPVQETVPDNLIAVLPLGAHEQHGPHLPFETDTIIADGIAARLADNLPEHITARFLTTEPVGYSVEHMDVEGSRSLAFSEAVNRWIGIGKISVPPIFVSWSFSTPMAAIPRWQQLSPQNCVRV